MNNFAIARPDSYEAASAMTRDRTYKLAVLKAGGVDLLDHLKGGLIDPDVLIDVRRVREAGAKDPVGISGGVIRVEAGATLAEIARSDELLRAAPVLGQAAGDAASPQVRNAATVAGNLLQRPRCWYYRNAQFPCLKKGGSTCFAVEGENRYHAIFGPGPCHIVHPSNMAPALLVGDAVVHLTGSGRKELPLSELYHMPDKGVMSENNLEAGEVVTHITCRPMPNSAFYAIKEKQSFDWPVAAAAVAVELNGATITSARVVAAAVAPVPWWLPNVEAALKGVDVANDEALRKACAIAAEGAKPMTDNGYKVKMLPVAVRRAVLRSAGRPTEVES
ncbi:MAG: FAD binding domain-containing protein [Phycisphaerales bacterium]|nr:FAD binding domain-containing protein [Planctomycetota bacterium]